MKFDPNLCMGSGYVCLTNGSRALEKIWGHCCFLKECGSVIWWTFWNFL